MKVKDDTHHGRLKMDEPKKEPTTTARFSFGDMRTPFMKLSFYNAGGSNPLMAGGKNILAGNKVRQAPEFICGHIRILEMHLIVQTHHMVNLHMPQFSSDSTLGTAHDRVNQHGAGHSDDRLDSTFGDAVLMSRTSSTKADVLVLFN